MNSKLERSLMSVGKRVFVEYFFMWNNMTPELLSRYEDFTHKSYVSRIWHAKSIIKNNDQINALNLIINSKTDQQTKIKAKKILEEL